MLELNQKAPDFSAKDQNNKEHRLSDYLGKWVLLYFYPSDFTPGCTTEACELRDNFEELSKHLVILGVSRNSVDSHKRFADKYGLQFTLLSDSDKQMTKNYGADGLILAKRVSFLIDPEGKVAKIYEKVIPAEHATQIIEDIKALQAS